MHVRRGNVRFMFDPAFEGMLEKAGLFDFERTLAREDLLAAKAVLTSRRTYRLRLDDGADYYLKRYFRIPFFEALRDRFRAAVMRSPIAREWHALRRMAQVMIPAPRVLLAAESGLFGIVRRGYVLTRGLAVKTTLEALAKGAVDGPADRAALDRKRALIEETALLLRTLHRNGIAHRDFYLGHLVLAPWEDGSERVHVLDLNRAEIGADVPEHRRVKDLAALDFSAPPRLVSRADRRRFLETYLFPNERADLGRIMRLVRAKSARMRRHVERQVARGVPNFHVGPR